MRFFNQPLTADRPGTKTLRDGSSTTPDWALAETITHPSVNIQSGSGGIDRTEEGDFTTETVTVYGPPGVELDVQPGDRFHHDGKLWRLEDGGLRTEYHPVTGAHHHHWFVLEAWEASSSRGR